MVLVFSVVDVVCHIDLCMLNHPCDPEVNSAWSWYMIFYIFFLLSLLIFC